MKLTDRAIGLAMRVYRKSPFWPYAGKFLAKALARFSKTDRVVQMEIDGLAYELHLNEVIDSSIYYSRTFETNIERLMDDLVQPGMTVLDIGANVGYHTVRLARNTGPEGRVIAIEPTAWARQRLEKNIQLNGLANCSIQALGLSDAEEGICRVFFQSSYPLHGQPHVIEESIRLTSLHVLAGEIGLSHVGFIKLDVDGFEEKVIAGAMKILERDHPILLIEVTPPPASDKKSQVLSMLESLGYQFFDESRRVVPNASTNRAWRKGQSPVNLIAVTEAHSLNLGRGRN